MTITRAQAKLRAEQYITQQRQALETDLAVYYKQTLDTISKVSGEGAFTAEFLIYPNRLDQYIEWLKGLGYTTELLGIFQGFSEDGLFRGQRYSTGVVDARKPLKGEQWGVGAKQVVKVSWT